MTTGPSGAAAAPLYSLQPFGLMPRLVGAVQSLARPAGSKVGDLGRKGRKGALVMMEGTLAAGHGQNPRLLLTTIQ